MNLRYQKKPDQRPRVETVDDIVAWGATEYGYEFQPFNAGPGLVILAREVVRLRAELEQLRRVGEPGDPLSEQMVEHAAKAYQREMFGGRLDWDDMAAEDRDSACEAMAAALRAVVPARWRDGRS